MTNRREGHRCFPALDIIKLLMAVLVVAIHVDPLAASRCTFAKRVFDGISCIAVPFFFTSSSFLCFVGLLGEESGEQIEIDRVQKTGRRMARLYVSWTILYLPVTILGFHLVGYSLIRSTLTFFRNALFVGENFCSWPLWYLLASAVSFYLVFALLDQGLGPKQILFLSGVLLLAGDVINSIYMDELIVPLVIERAVDAYFLIFGTVRNGLFLGFFYVSLGMVIAHHRNLFEQITPQVLIVLSVLGSSGCIFISNCANLPYCAVFSTSIFLLAIKRHGSVHPNARNMSTVMYLLHMYWKVFIVYIVNQANTIEAMDSTVPPMQLFASVLCLSLLSGFAAILLGKRYERVGRLFGIRG